MLNDKSAWFIIDTGATITMLNEMEAEYFGFTFLATSDLKEKQINSLSHQLVLSQTSLCKINIGQLTIRQRLWRSKEMNRLFQTIMNDENIRVAGILGSDLLSTYGININYGSRTLSYKVRKAMDH